MFKGIKLLFSLVVTLLLTNISNANDSILDYDVTIEVNAVGKVYVTEVIKMNISQNRNSKEIYRELPLKQKLHTNLKIFSVTKNNNKIRFKTKVIGDNLRIYLTKGAKSIPAGMNLFIIKYSLENLVDFSEQYDRISYNLISQNWQMKIDNLAVTVKLPPKIDPARVDAYIEGSDQSSLEQSLDVYNQLVFESGREIEAGENVVVSLVLPKNKLSKNFSKIIDSMDSYISLLMLFFSFTLMLKHIKTMRKVSYYKFTENAMISCSFLCISLFFVPKYRYSFVNYEFFMIIILILLPFICLSRFYKKLFAREFNYYCFTFLVLLAVVGYFSKNFTYIPTLCVFLILATNITLALTHRQVKSKLCK